MRIIAVIALVIALLTLQTTLLASLVPFCPDFSIALAIYIAFICQVRSGTILTFFLGYLLDLFLRTPPGLHSLSLTLLYLAIRPMHDKIRIEGFGPLAILGFFGSLFTSFLTFFLTHILLGNLSFESTYVDNFVLTAITTSICTPIFIKAIQRLSSQKSSKKERDLL